MRALVTGATGFVGRVLCRQLSEEGVFVRAAVRDRQKDVAATEVLWVGDVNGQTAWAPACCGIDTVFHLAAVAHIVDRTTQDSAPYERVNADGTAELARQAAQAGVRRLVFISSLKVNGEVSAPEGFREDDPVHPDGAYGVSKAHAEEGLIEVARTSGLEYAILRPPLVYGPGVRANFLALMRLVDRGWPLPLASVHNRRSLIYVENLASALRCLATHAKAGGETFFASDGAPLSTADLIRRIAAALGRPARLLPAPPALLRILSTTMGKREVFEKLAGSMVVDDRKIRTLVGWQPPHTIDEGLAATAAWYHRARAS